MSFIKAYYPMHKIEKGYVDDLDDRGGETYDGMSRNANPNSAIWGIIDSRKSSPDFPACLKQDEYVLGNILVNEYKQKYWYAPGIDRVDVLDEFLAEKLFRLCVNFGHTRPCKWFQRALNYLNRDEKYYNNIDDDGDIGNETIKTLRLALKHNPPIRILIVMCLQQGAKYLDIWDKDETQEKYVGWIDRIFAGIFFETIDDFKELDK